MPIVPAVVYAEWWRGKSAVREDVLAAIVIEDMPPSLCRAAGEALRAIKNSSLADAVVMASAALRGGGVVYFIGKRRDRAKVLVWHRLT